MWSGVTTLEWAKQCNNLINNWDKHNNENSKLLCVICNDIYFKTNKNKIYKIGFENNTLTYLNNLGNIINSYFNL